MKPWLVTADTVVIPAFSIIRMNINEKGNEGTALFLTLVETRMSDQYCRKAIVLGSTSELRVKRVTHMYFMPGDTVLWTLTRT